MPGSTQWISSEPSAIEGEHETDAILAVRLGLAVNALNAQLSAMKRVSADPEKYGAVAMRDSLLSLFSLAAYTKEALKVLTGSHDAPAERDNVERLARDGGADESLIDQVGTLCDGCHQADAVLKKVRNKLVFHWDRVVVAESLREFARNEELVWLEAADKTRGANVYRLSTEVLLHAVLHAPIVGSADKFNQLSSQERVQKAMDPVTEAAELILKLFEAAIAGFLSRAGGRLRS